jgi:hypothetical protein
MGLGSNMYVIDLSIVAENHKEDQVDEVQGEEGQDSGEDWIQDLAIDMQHLYSPSGVSQMSGASATSGWSSHTGKEIASIDSSLGAEKLPELFTRSWQILDLLAPENMSTTNVESIVNDLKLPGSKLGRRLKFAEDSFKIVRQLYGSEGDTYIQIGYVFRKMLGTEQPSDGRFRPDAILQAANIATMMTKLLVMPGEIEWHLINLLDLDEFPKPFVTTFNDRIGHGNSALFQISFEMALDIWTQCMIVSMISKKELDDFNPEKLLALQFFKIDGDVDSLDDLFDNGLPRGLPGGPSLSNEQIIMARDRVLQIRSAFRKSEEAQDEGEQVDFDQLRKMFPWLQFLSSLATWSRARLAEISKNIEQQGNVETITRELIRTIENINSQASISDEPPTPPRRLAPAAEIPQGRYVIKHLHCSPTRALLIDNSFINKESVEFLLRLGRASSSNPQSKTLTPLIKTRARKSGTVLAVDNHTLPDPSKPGEPPRKKMRTQVRMTAPAPQPDDLVLPAAGDDDDIWLADNTPRPTAQYAQVDMAYAIERNKENRPAAISRASKSLLDPQPNAVKDTWSSQEEDVVSAKQTSSRAKQQNRTKTSSSILKRPRPTVVEDEDLSQDEGFEGDKRIPDQSRRIKPRLPWYQSHVREELQTAKQARTTHEVPEAPTEPPRPSPRSDRNVSVRERERHDDNFGDNEFADIAPTPREVAEVARIQTIKAAKKLPQKRIPWSDNDTNLLVSGIENYGTRWSVLWSLPGWEVARDQVALKDKGRNLKVSYLK